MLPSREELMMMPITVLEHQNIESQEEEMVVQEVLNKRRASMPVQGEIYRNDIIAQNIQTQEEEAEAQRIIDERVAKLRPQAVVEEVPEVSQNLPIPPVELKVKFCEFCDSKGVRHKLNCTRPNKEKV
jgi:hypothetical protein